MSFFERAGLMRPLEGGAFAATNATVTGDVTLGADVGIWFGCVLRGDDAPLTVGARTNIQDLTMIHADTGVPNVIGAGCTVGHRAILHGAEVGDRCLIGMGAIIMDGVTIEDEVIIAAGSLVTPGTRCESRALYVGSPARWARALTGEEIAQLAYSAGYYVTVKDRYL